MSETVPRNQQFVGSSEAPSSKEFMFTPEQQQVADIMKSSGEKLEKSGCRSARAFGWFSGW